MPLSPACGTLCVKQIVSLRLIQPRPCVPIGTAIDECIEKGILAEFLRKERAKVVSVLYDYDAEAVRRMHEEDMQKLEEKIRIGQEKLAEKDAQIRSLMDKMNV